MDEHYLAALFRPEQAIRKMLPHAGTETLL